MGKKILLGWLVLTCLLLSTTANAENVVYLNYISISTPKNDVLRYQRSSKSSMHIHRPFMDIQHAYVSVNGLTMTLKMKMGGTAILNNSMICGFEVKFYVNSSIEVDIATDGSNQAIVSGYDTYVYDYRVHSQGGGPLEVYAKFNKTVTYLNGRYIYWNLDLTGLNKFIPINQIFINYSIFKDIQTKYEVYPNLHGFITSTHPYYQIIDGFNMSQPNPPAISKYFWPTLISTSLFVGIITVSIIYRKRIYKLYQNWKIKRLPKNSELYPEDPNK